MPVTIRLMRFGKKGSPTYRVVALDKRKKRDGSYIEKVGLYNPMTEPATIQLNEERLQYWMKNGAVISEGMRKLLKKNMPGAKTMKKEVKESIETKIPAKEAKTAPKATKAAVKKTAKKE